MKKILSFLIVLVLLVGCGKLKEEEVPVELGKKITNIDGYYSKALMEVKRGNDVKKYDLEISYSEPNYFKVKMINQDNNSTQMILKNDEGVFVITPELNKSFQFQSEWPLNTSHAYLYQSLVSDILNDENTSVMIEEDEIIIRSEVAYKTNSDLKTQKVVLDVKTLLPKEVIVYDSKMEPVITVVFIEFDLNKKFDNNYFDKELNLEAETLALGEGGDYLREVNYPNYYPEGVRIVSEQVTNEYAITCFGGDTGFTIYQQFVDDLNSSILPQFIYGEPILVNGTFGALGPTSISWYSAGSEYMIVSNNLTQDELFEVARSFTIEYGK
ncbi:outer membrane lipoprotein carrier protein LolA [Mycoplasmatota bacterium zrk1]